MKEPPEESPPASPNRTDAGLSMLAGKNPRLFMDKLGERLAFERISTRLYDVLVTKCDTMMDDGEFGLFIDDLQKIRADEERHLSILVDAIRMLGGDPNAQTSWADMAATEASGLMQVMTDPRTNIAQSLHALLMAEMADNAGWEMLIALAEDNQRSELISDFSVALDEERAHLQQVQRWFEEATLGASYSDEATDLDESPAQRPH